MRPRGTTRAIFGIIRAIIGIGFISENTKKRNLSVSDSIPTLYSYNVTMLQCYNCYNSYNMKKTEIQSPLCLGAQSGP